MIELNPPHETVSEIVQEQLDLVRKLEKTYEPNDDIKRRLAHKVLIPIVGPCAVGKSYVIETLIANYPDFAQVYSLSTRKPRPDDTPATMRNIPWTNRAVQDMCDTIEVGEAVQYVFHPKTDDIYATTLDCYPGTYNLLPALSGSIPGLERLPFQAMPITGLVTTPEAWTEWFDRRVFSSPADRTARIGEAASSLQWLIDNPQVAIIANIPGKPEHAARAIHALATAPVSPTPPRDEALARTLYQHVLNS